MHRALLLALLALGLLAGPLHAVQPDEMLPDAAQEARARQLSKELRCMVCQNQSIDDSDAPLAKDLRLLVRERIKAGDSDGQVMDFLVSRYGEFVLLRPTLHGANIVLWLAPFLVLVVGGAGLWLAYRRRGSRPAPTAPLSNEEEEKLRRVLSENSGDVTKL
ncbi:cytochrome c-type biogenesis protein [Ancylobacter amanitiformis]|uniref:Cytochrome c-type biogenesis protein n=1 Tax=Ancylobacter amanitiformis TaxID=217069 RepID=A0ABU0LM39_9HYPH|nr:cytochrome c-type biogenesis protein [Ancylobacter amanitiformis]MDQ0509767.1 cytochrome c-type biogenesis protein CcmH [Ancylobacter amanitiformis]